MTSFCSDYGASYAAHRGPFSLLITREATRRVKGEDRIVPTTDHCRGPFTAEEAHEEARMQVGDPRDCVAQIHVFSENEQQFTGAYYERGQVIPTWDEIQRREIDDDRMVPAVASDQEALLSGEPEPLQRVDTVGRAPTSQQSPAVPAMPPKVKKRGAILGLDAGCAEQWPKSEAAQVVRTYLENHRGTAGEIADAVGPQLKELGVEFPAALISRLKQAGFLRECHE